MSATPQHVYRCKGCSQSARILERLGAWCYRDGRCKSCCTHTCSDCVRGRLLEQKATELGFPDSLFNQEKHQ